MRFNNQLLTQVTEPIQQVDKFEIYPGTLPAAVADAPYTPGGISDIDTATLETDGAKMPALANPAYPEHFFSSADGAKAIVVDNSMLYSFAPSTAGDWNTLGTSTSSATVGWGSATGVQVMNDGINVYACVEQDSEGVAVIHASLGTAWEASSKGADASQALTGVDYAAGIAVADDGLSMILFNNGGSGSRELIQFSMSTAHDISTLTEVTRHSVTDVILALLMLDGGKKLLYRTAATVKQLDLSTAWSVATISDNNKSLNMTNAVSGITGFAFDAFSANMILLGSMSLQPVYLSSINSEVLVDLTAAFTADANNSFSSVQDGDNIKINWQGATVQGTASADGTMGYFVMHCSGGGKEFKLDGVVAQNGGGGDLEFATVDLLQNDTVEITSLSFTLKNTVA